MKQLRALYEASTSGKRSDVSAIFMNLPDEAQGILSLVQYAGRFGGWSPRQRRFRLKRERSEVEQGRERCPKCGSTNFEQTTVGYLDGHDKNRRTCHACQYQWRP